MVGATRVRECVRVCGKGGQHRGQVTGVRECKCACGEGVCDCDYDCECRCRCRCRCKCKCE